MIMNFEVDKMIKWKKHDGSSSQTVFSVGDYSSQVISCYTTISSCPEVPVKAFDETEFHAFDQYHV